MQQDLRKSAPYVFLGQTTSLCEQCCALVPAKVLLQEGRVYYHKRCPSHGVHKTLISTDGDYYQLAKTFLKPGDRPRFFHSRTDYGCPLDCGLCPDHEQHSCLAILEVNQHCNLSCPTCFASSSPAASGVRDLATIEAMMDALVAAEGEPDLLQISGGEPTLHPQIFEILALAKRKPIRHLMLNTNGLRIAREPDFVMRLAEYAPGFEIYLQFDSLRAEALKTIRGADLRRIRQQALENLERAGLATTLVCTIRRGANEDECGEIVRHALQWSCVRGVTFQPTQDSGRNEGFEKSDRVVLSEIRSNIAQSSGVFSADDLIPLPCHPEMIGIGYGLRRGQRVVPVTSLLSREEILAAAPNAITFEKHPGIREKLVDLFSLGSFSDDTEKLASFLCCLPQFPAPERLSYADVFRVAIVEFMDRFNFDLGGVKRSCIHFLTPDRQIIPFDTYNLFYRNGEIEALRRRSQRLIPENINV
ncbi:MAG: radical SAM protein [Xanthomonadales bacterium]|nr:radical SAM protein [Xanthomonadales bacterium]